MRNTRRGTAGRIHMLLALIVAALLALGPLPAPALAEAAEQMSEEGVDDPAGGGEAPAVQGEGSPAEGEDVAEGEVPAEDDKAAEENPAAEGQMSEEGADDGDAMQSEDGGAALAAQSDEADGPALAAQSVSVSNPRRVANSSMQSGQVATWDCVWFGSYPQTEVKPGDAAYASLQSASWTDGDATVGGVRYRRIERSDTISADYWPNGAGTYRYFRYEPIKWRVLKVSGSTALVVADAALDCRPYDKDYEEGRIVTWETSTIRAWVNGTGSTPHYSAGAQNGRTSLGFSTVAFPSDVLRAAVLETTVVNADNVDFGTDGGKDTKDKVFLLSESEVYGSSATSHGFAAKYVTFDEARRCMATDYANAMGAAVNSDGPFEGNCAWWLRSPGDSTSLAVRVYAGGLVDHGGCGIRVNSNAVRPALTLDLSSLLVSYAGTVSSDGGVHDPSQVEDISAATVEPIKGRGYDGKPYEPEPKVTLNGKVLAKDTDYTLSYRNNVSAGKATLTVTGIGGYTGTKTATYEVWRNGQPMDAWAVARQAPATSLRSRDVTVEAPIHVAHAVSAAKPMEFRKVGGDSRLNVDVATGRVTIRRGTPAGTYKVTIRAIAFGGANYADGSRTVECQVRVVGGKLDQDLQVTAADVTRTAASLASADYLTRPFKVALAAGAVTYKPAGGSGCLSVDSAGRLRVAKGTRAGTYYAKAYATAAGDAGYRSCTRTVTAKVVVR